MKRRPRLQRVRVIATRLSTCRRHCVVLILGPLRFLFFIHLRQHSRPRVFDAFDGQQTLIEFARYPRPANLCSPQANFRTPRSTPPKLRNFVSSRALSSPQPQQTQLPLIPSSTLFTTQQNHTGPSHYYFNRVEFDNTTASS